MYIIIIINEKIIQEHVHILLLLRGQLGGVHLSGQSTALSNSIQMPRIVETVLTRCARKPGTHTMTQIKWERDGKRKRKSEDFWWFEIPMKMSWHPHYHRMVFGVAVCVCDSVNVFPLSRSCPSPTCIWHFDCTPVPRWPTTPDRPASVSGPATGGAAWTPWQTPWSRPDRCRPPHWSGWSGWWSAHLWLDGISRANWAKGRERGLYLIRMLLKRDYYP